MPTPGPLKWILMSEKQTGRILRSLSGFYDVRTPAGIITCRARGILRKEGLSPLTGDMVEITVERGKGMVEKVLPRKNSFFEKFLGGCKYF